MSLRLRLLRTISLVLVATLALGSVLIYWHAVRKVETEMQAAIATGRRIAAIAVGETSDAARPQRRLERLIADFDGDRHLKAMLIGPDGAELLASRPQVSDSQVPRWLYRTLAGDTASVVVKLPPTLESFGSVVLRADPKNEVAEVWNDAKLYMAILATFCLLTAAALYVTLGHALRPLQDLLAAFGRVGEGDYAARVPLRSPREFAELSRGFNNMAERLGAMEEHTTRLRGQLDTVQDEERAELARNLHDEVSPLLFSIDVDAITVRQRAAAGDGENNIEVMRELDSRASSIQQAVAQLKRNVKAILGQLRPAGSHGMPLKGEIENLVAFWAARHPDKSFLVDIPEASWGSKLDSTLHAIIRESLSNALKHSNARRIEVRVREQPDRVLGVEIADDGGGLRPSDSRGFGMIGMRERATLLGGTFEVAERREPSGVVVRAAFPLVRQTGSASPGPSAGAPGGRSAPAALEGAAP